MRCVNVNKPTLTAQTANKDVLYHSSSLNQSKPPQSIHPSQRDSQLLHMAETHSNPSADLQDKEPFPSETADVIYSLSAPGPCHTRR